MWESPIIIHNFIFPAIDLRGKLLLVRLFLLSYIIEIFFRHCFLGWLVISFIFAFWDNAQPALSFFYRFYWKGRLHLLFRFHKSVMKFINEILILNKWVSLCLVTLITISRWSQNLICRIITQAELILLFNTPVYSYLYVFLLLLEVYVIECLEF